MEIEDWLLYTRVFNYNFENVIALLKNALSSQGFVSAA